MSAVILKDLKEHVRYRKWKQLHIDPRNASRTPSASKELMYRLRYESPLGASPSRQLDHQKPFYDDDPTFDRSTSYRGSVGRSFGTTPSYNGMLIGSQKGKSLGPQILSKIFLHDLFLKINVK